MRRIPRILTGVLLAVALLVSMTKLPMTEMPASGSVMASANAAPRGFHPAARAGRHLEWRARQ